MTRTVTFIMKILNRHYSEITMRQNDFTNGLKIKLTMFLVQSPMVTVTWSDMVQSILDDLIIELQAVLLICQKFVTIHMQ